MKLSPAGSNHAAFNLKSTCTSSNGNTIRPASVRERMPTFKGNPEMARRRLELLAGILLLEVTEAAQQLAVAIVERGLLPQTAYPDALHIGTAAVHDVDYLLTWNCAHIANAEILPRVALICEGFGLTLPYICTPEELLGDPQ